MSSPSILCESCGDEKQLKDLWWCSGERCYLLLCSFCRVSTHDQTHGQLMTAFAELKGLEEVYSALSWEEEERRMRLRGVFVSLADALWDSGSDGLCARLARLHPGLRARAARQPRTSQGLNVERARRLGEQMLRAMGGQEEDAGGDILDRVLELGVAELKKELVKVLGNDKTFAASDEQGKISKPDLPPAMLLAAKPEVKVEAQGWEAAEPAAKHTAEEISTSQLRPDTKETKDDCAPAVKASSQSQPRTAIASPATKPTAKVEPTSTQHGRIFIFGGDGRERRIESLFPSHVDCITLEGQPHIAVRPKVATCQLSAFLGGQRGQVQIFTLDGDLRLTSSRLAGGAKRMHQGGAAIACRPSDYGPAIFLIGGGEASRADECEKLQAAIWHRLPRLGQRRSHFATVEFGGHIYAIGGDDGEQASPLASVERLPVKAGAEAWEAVAPLPHPLRHHAAAAVNSTVVVAGGERLDGSSTKTTWLMAPGDSGAVIWRPGPDLNIARSRHGIVALGGAVYAIGGIEILRRNGRRTFEQGMFKCAESWGRRWTSGRCSRRSSQSPTSAYC